MFTIVEVYEGRDAFTAHRESAHFASIGKMQIIPLLESRVVVGYEGDGVIG
ncbi:antibiotic biosynthesis monooxygenase [Agrococcus sp. ARC_14]|nr:antibiotic biosynthesis monooxygenase [Agrococcus sp. ARC_14]